MSFATLPEIESRCFDSTHLIKKWTLWASLPLNSARLVQYSHQISQNKLNKEQLYKKQGRSLELCSYLLKFLPNKRNEFVRLGGVFLEFAAVLLPVLQAGDRGGDEIVGNERANASSHQGVSGHQEQAHSPQGVSQVVWVLIVIRKADQQKGKFFQLPSVLKYIPERKRRFHQ